MTDPVLPMEGTVAPAGPGVPPPMPSIAASAVLESRLLLGRARQVLATWLTRG